MIIKASDATEISRKNENGLSWYQIAADNNDYEIIDLFRQAKNINIDLVKEKSINESSRDKYVKVTGSSVYKQPVNIGLIMNRWFNYPQFRSQTTLMQTLVLLGHMQNSSLRNRWSMKLKSLRRLLNVCIPITLYFGLTQTCFLNLIFWNLAEFPPHSKDSLNYDTLRHGHIIKNKNYGRVIFYIC